MNYSDKQMMQELEQGFETWLSTSHGGGDYILCLRLWQAYRAGAAFREAMLGQSSIYNQAKALKALAESEARNA